MNVTTHPAYLRARNRLVTELRARLHVSLSRYPIVFLCGAANSSARPYLREYLSAHRPDWLVFLADDVWTYVEEYGALNSLDMEEELARLADAVVIVVESPGTFAELGAFSANEQLREKLLLILDESYENHPSFINTGPVHWVDQYSRIGKSVYCSLDSISPSLSRVVMPLDDYLPSRRFDTITYEQMGENPRHLLPLIADLVSIVGPAEPREIRELLELVLDTKPEWRTDTLLGLAVSLALVDRLPESRLYSRSIVDSKGSGLIRQTGFDIRRARARFIGAYRHMPGEWSRRFGVSE